MGGQQKAPFSVALGIRTGTWHTVRLACTWLALACGGGGTEPVPTYAPGVSIVSGAVAMDTIDAILTQPLTVRVADTEGRPIRGAVVRFIPTEISTTPGMFMGYTTRVSPAPLTAVATWGVITEAVTNEDGLAQAMVRLGEVAGKGGVAVRAGYQQYPFESRATTTTFTVNPGGVASIAMLPADTSLYVGSRLVLRSIVSDRHGNVRDDAVSYTAPDGRVSVSGSTITGAAIGRVPIRLTAGGFTDSAAVSVVPRGTIIAQAGIELAGERCSLYMFDLDGSNFRLVVETSAAAGTLARLPAWWTPDGKSVVYADALLSGTIRILDPSTGSWRRLPSAENQLAHEDWPSVSRDGAWVYFQGVQAAYQSGLYRISIDGTILEPLRVFGISYPPAPAVRLSSPSPDGTRVVFYDDTGWLLMLDVATKNVRPLGPQGIGPAWSPVSEEIAFIGAPVPLPNYPNTIGPLMVINSDGSGLRRVTQRNMFYMRPSWSPDGKYLITSSGGRIVVVNFATGEEIPITINAVSKPFLLPAWRP